jgi:hypothetical protein
MADGEKSKKSFDPSEERYKYIGFDVYPGKAGDMFKSDEERKTLVEKVLGKLARSQGEVRDRCTLIESRLSGLEKVFLTIAALALVVSLFIPWFSGYIPVSYTELGSIGSHTFFFASKADEKGIDDLALALKEKHDRRYNNQLGAGPEETPAAVAVEDQEPFEETVEEPVEEVVPDQGDAGLVEEGAEGVVADMEGAEGETPVDGENQPPPPPEEQVEEAPVIPDEIKIIFVNTPQIEQLHGVKDLGDYVVAFFTYNARTGQENLVYGAGSAVRALPENIILRAQVNDSISTAVTDSMKLAATERIEAGDSSITSVDSIFYAGPVLVNDKAISELAMKGIINDNYSITGIGALLKLGTYGSMIFSSGIVLVITGVLLIVYFVSCLILAVLNLFLLYGVKKSTEEQYVIHLKRMLRYNWIPVLLWLFMFVISFFGASYGFESSNMLAQVGNSYGITSFIGLSSFGIYVSLAAFLIVALKGKEI